MLPISEGVGITERLIYRLLHPGGADSSDGFDYVGAYPVEVLHWVVRIIGCELSVYLRERLGKLAARLRTVRPEIAESADYKWLSDVSGSNPPPDQATVP